MGNVWDKTINVSQSLVTALLASQFDLTIHTIKLLGEGYDNSAFLINNQYVFRFVHREQLSPTCMANEITLLPYLSEHLSFTLPKLIMIGKPTESYPFQFAGYKILSGELLTKHQAPLVNNLQFATILGTWLKELHALPIQNTHRNLLQGEHDWRLHVADRIQRVVEVVAQYKQYFINAGFEPELLIERVGHFKDLKIDKSVECYAHGDLYAKHILVNANGLPAGLIDWGDIHIGHPATDLSIGMMIFDENALKTFLAAYQNDTQEMLDVALFRAFFHAIHCIPYFSENNESVTVDWAKAALNNALSLMD